APGSTGYPNHTGIKTFTYTIPADGTYTLAIGSVNVGDQIVNSAVLVDNVKISSVPPPPAEARWALAPPAGPGTYDLYVTWVPAATAATNVKYQVFDDTTPIGSVTVNQQQAPNDVMVNGTIWRKLGAFTTTTGSFQVAINSGSVDGEIIADA